MYCIVVLWSLDHFWDFLTPSSLFGHFVDFLEPPSSFPRASPHGLWMPPNKETLKSF